MRKVIMLVALMILAVGRGPAEGKEKLGEGIPDFDLELYLDTRPVSDRTYDIDVLSGSEGEPNEVADVTIVIPSGITVVRGDTERRVHPSALWRGRSDSEWWLRIRVDGEGDFAIHAYIKIYGPGSEQWRESDCVLEFGMHGESIEWKKRYETRFERVENGQRFRYGGAYMVAIDHTEAILPGHIREGPKVVQQQDGNCKGCAAGAPDERVRLVVTVGSDGRVRWIRPRGRSEPKVDPRLLAAAEAAVRYWQFRPAMTDAGVPTAHWAEANVVVHTSADK